MNINNLLLPHPVLGREDDVLGEFKVKEDGFTIHQIEDKTILSFDLFLNNITLEKLIHEGKAFFNIEVECSATFYRKSFLYDNPTFKIEINKNDLRGKVRVSIWITTNAKISDYKIDGANSDYNNSLFEVEIGDVLAFAGRVNFNADILWEDLRRIFNIMKIRKDEEHKEGPAIFDLDSDIIFISLSKKDYIEYENYREEDENFTPIYHSSLVLSALIYALSEMMSIRKDEYKEWKWYRVLDSQRLNREEISAIWDPKNIPLIAQKMLGEPIERMLISIENISSR